MDDGLYDPAHIPAPGSYHWTPRLQRQFLEAFAATGSVRNSAARVGMSSSAVYQLKQRAEGAAFRLGCAAAVLIARGRIADELLDRAINGFDETTTVYRDEDRRFVKRRRLDARLGLAMLARLDRMADTPAPRKGALVGEDGLAQLIAGDWPAFLSLFDAAEAAQGGAAFAPDAAPETGHMSDSANDGANEDANDDTKDGAFTPATGAARDAAAGMPAALALWLAARDNRANPIAMLWRESAIANEVAQISADFDDAVNGPNAAEGVPASAPSPERAAAAMSVWYDGERDEWRTDFPPPADFIGDEEGEFGDPDYERTLDPAEEDAWETVRERESAPLRTAGEAARRAWFGLPAPANDTEAAEAAGDAGTTGDAAVPGHAADNAAAPPPCANPPAANPPCPHPRSRAL